MTNWLITQYPDRFAAAITGAGITNWISDYGTADIYRTKETEFFGTPWDKDARDRMIKQSPLTYAGNVKTPTLFVHGEVDQRVPYEEGEQMYFALKRRGIPGEDDPVRRPAARHRRALEQRPPHAQRAEVVEHVSEGEAAGDDDGGAVGLASLGRPRSLGGLAALAWASRFALAWARSLALAQAGLKPRHYA